MVPRVHSVSFSVLPRRAPQRLARTGTVTEPQGTLGAEKLAGRVRERRVIEGMRISLVIRIDEPMDDASYRPRFFFLQFRHRQPAGIFIATIITGDGARSSWRYGGLDRLSAVSGNL